MKNQDLNKLKIYKTASIILAILLIVSTSLGIVTNGFSVWDKFYPKNNRNPIISIQIDPLIINIDSETYKREQVCTFNVETSNGAYKILKDFKITNLKIENPHFFSETISNDSIKFTHVVIDRLILDNRAPDQIGLFKFETDFVLSPYSGSYLKEGSQVEIGYFFLYFPYEFENQKFTEKIRVPVILKKGKLNFGL